MKNSVLVINDITGYGKVSTMAMTPILAKYNYHVYTLPTAIVSNTLEYGLHSILDTTSYMKEAINTWGKNGFKFENISTGFINSEDQIEIIIDFIASQGKPFVLVDPIMADNGVLYDGMCEGIVEYNRELISHSDIIVPNFTEATMLADMYQGETALSSKEFSKLSDKLLEMGAKHVVISDCISKEDNLSFNLVRDPNYDTFLSLPYSRYPEQYVGTGDVFSAVILAEFLNGNTLSACVNSSANFIKELIKFQKTIKNDDHYDLYLEGCLDLLNKL